MAPHPHLTEAARPAATTEAVLQVQATAEDHREVIEDSHIKIADI